MGRLGWELAGRARCPSSCSTRCPRSRRCCAGRSRPGCCGRCRHNQRRGVDDVHLYEMGDVFDRPAGASSRRSARSSAACSPGVGPPGLERRAASARLLRRQGRRRVPHGGARHRRGGSVRAAELPWLQPGRAPRCSSAAMSSGWLGEVAPPVLDAYEAHGPVVLFETRPASAPEGGGRRPRVRRAAALPGGGARRRARRAGGRHGRAGRAGDRASAGGKLLESVRLFDVYRGPGSARAGRKSLAFALTYRAPDRTLTDEEVAAVHEKLVRKVTGAVGGEVRA